MKSITRVVANSGALVLAGVLTLAGCGSDGGKGGGGGGAIACPGGPGTLLAAGSTAQAPAMDLWRNQFQRACPGLSVSYGGGGSGAGVQQFEAGRLAFAGTDAALTAGDTAATKAACPGGQGIDLPMVGGLVAIVFNVDGVTGLTLDGATTAKIFDSQIKKWNDSRIAALNPGVALPDADITSFHRSDDSGTTFNLTSYFAATSGGAWPAPGNKTWKGEGGQSATGSAGVSAQVERVKNSIGYVELSYAQQDKLNAAKIATAPGRAVAASAADAATTIAASSVAGTGADLALRLDYGTTAADAYPIVLVTYEVVCDKGNKPATLPAVKAFLGYTASAAGQQAIAGAGYVPLPNALTGRVKGVIDKLG
ncbi:phosphate ABC transporter substrate-binding protein PstS [Kitasatospora viridis]|uniref:phosphate ABC transporter substrate-binding protein PstS n=1 Tax=Kitasatospora viridis TaxID=281105 RepID=UPI001FECAE63|nr:phosphate ABC transporter substrate-binding protein PstS [Kitasatospora viridis]